MAIPNLTGLLEGFLAARQMKMSEQEMMFRRELLREQAALRSATEQRMEREYQRHLRETAAREKAQERLFQTEQFNEYTEPGKAIRPGIADAGNYRGPATAHLDQATAAARALAQHPNTQVVPGQDYPKDALGNPNFDFSAPPYTPRIYTNELLSEDQTIPPPPGAIPPAGQPPFPKPMAGADFLRDQYAKAAAYIGLGKEEADKEKRREAAATNHAWKVADRELTAAKRLEQMITVLQGGGVIKDPSGVFEFVSRNRRDMRPEEQRKWQEELNTMKLAAAVKTATAHRIWREWDKTKSVPVNAMPTEEDYASALTSLGFSASQDRPRYERALRNLKKVLARMGGSSLLEQPEDLFDPTRIPGQ